MKGVQCVAPTSLCVNPESLILNRESRILSPSIHRFTDSPIQRFSDSEIWNSGLGIVGFSIKQERPDMQGVQCVAPTSLRVNPESLILNCESRILSPSIHRFTDSAIPG